MDDNFEKKKRSEIDLTEFDLEPFKEYFEEEDAQKAAAAKAEKERIIREEAEKAAKLKAKKEAELKKKQEAERAAAEKAAKKKAEKEAKRKKEEARRAAEKAAQAALAAKRAEEMKKEVNMAKSARLLEHAQADNTLVPGTSEEKEEEGLEGFSSILSIDNQNTEFEEITAEDTETDDEFSNYVSEMPSSKSGLFTAICVVLILAFIGCAGFAGYTYFFAGSKAPAEASNTKYIGNSPEFAPYSSLQVNLPAANYPAGISEDLKAAYSQNSTLKGWLSIDGTPVDYPVVQSADNFHYLNNYNFYNRAARYGTPFMDYRCDAANLSKNTIIYSHHMNNDLYFGSLDKYENSNFYKDHPFIKYQTLNGSYTFKVYAAFYATTQADCDAGYVFDYYNPNMSDENFKGYIEMLKQYAIYTTDAGLEATDKIITLSTCSHVYDSLRAGGVDTRLVIVGRLVRQGEDISSAENTAAENTGYRRPQLWYDVNQKVNPYSEYRTWQAAN